MGAWGPAIFSDDTACDIRGDYRELLEDQVPDEEATQRVIQGYRHLGENEGHVLWLALAAAQSSLGRLDAAVKARALEIIDTGQGLQLWEEAGHEELRKRKAALAKLRAQLTGDQPSRKKVRRPWRHVTDLTTGDILSFGTEDGLLALFRVVRIDDQRVGAAPVVEWLDWQGHSLPRSWRLHRLTVRVRQDPGVPARPATYRVAKHKKKDPDWRECGFVHVDRLPVRPQDQQAQAWFYLTWTGLRTTVQRELAPDS